MFDLKHTIDTLLRQNQFASGGMLLMVLGGLAAYFRSIPAWCWHKIVDQSTLSVTINDDQASFNWLRRWLAMREGAHRHRRVDIFHASNGDTLVALAPGHHWLWHRGRPISLYFTRNEEKKDKWTKRSETITLRTLGRSRKFINQFLADIKEAFDKVHGGKPTLFVWSDSDWSEVEEYKPRPLDSVLLPDTHKAPVLRDIQVFQDSERWYAEMGIPYHRGYLFYGMPGSGKTSLITGLSSHFSAAVYILKISELNDRSLASAVQQATPHSMILLEDVDCLSIAASREKADRDQPSESVADKMGVTLSGLLNVLDGLLTPTGVMFFMTTNHIDKLDPALIRPGRVDLRLEFGLASEEQKRELYRRFELPGECPQEYIDTPLTMAELQSKLMQHRNEKLMQAIVPAVQEPVEEIEEVVSTAGLLLSYPDIT